MSVSMSSGPVGAVSFRSDLSLVKRSSIFSCSDFWPTSSSLFFFSFSLSVFLIFFLVDYVSKHCLGHSNQSISGSWQIMAIIASSICLSHILKMASLNTLMSSNKESSIIVSWLYVVVHPSLRKCVVIIPLGSWHRIVVGSHL